MLRLEFGQSVRPPRALPRPKHCPDVTNTTKMWPALPQLPPWSSTSNNVSGRTTAGDPVYVWTTHADRHRLGNQLFNYASLFGIAWSNRQHIHLWPDRSGRYAAAFHLRMPVDRGDHVRTNCETRPLARLEQGSAIYTTDFEHLPRGRNVSLSRYLQSFKYFRSVEHQLRLDLTFNAGLLGVARRWLDAVTPVRWRGMYMIRVAVHVRRTDYAVPRHERDGWPVAAGDYFRRAMAYFSDCLERVQFVVLSDDAAWCRANVRGPSEVVYTTHHSPFVDLAISSLCDHAIITIGSYGWWAAWFADGVIVTMKNLPRPGSNLARRYHRHDYYKPRWVGL